MDPGLDPNNAGQQNTAAMLFSLEFECCIATAPPIAASDRSNDLPMIKSSTIACLGFADHFLQHCQVDGFEAEGTAEALTPADLDKVLRGAGKVAVQLAKAFKVRTRPVYSTQVMLIIHSTLTAT